MNKLFILFFVLTAFISGGCNDDVEQPLNSRIYEFLDGRWQIHKVKRGFRNVTDDFQGVEWVFNDHGTVQKKLLNSGLVIDGHYTIKITQQCDAQDEDCIDQYQLDLYLGKNESFKHIRWVEVELGGMFMMLSEERNDTWYWYHLIKVP